VRKYYTNPAEAELAVSEAEKEWYAAADSEDSEAEEDSGADSAAGEDSAVGSATAEKAEEGSEAATAAEKAVVVVTVVVAATGDSAAVEGTTRRSCTGLEAGEGATAVAVTVDSAVAGPEVELAVVVVAKDTELGQWNTTCRRRHWYVHKFCQLYLRRIRYRFRKASNLPVYYMYHPWSQSVSSSVSSSKEYCL